MKVITRIEENKEEGFMALIGQRITWLANNHTWRYTMCSLPSLPMDSTKGEVK